MISRFIRIQLAIFIVLSVASLSIIVLVYGRVPELLGFGQRTMTMQLTDASGLYQGARVSYAGVEIGRVTDVTAGARGAAVTLSVSDDYDIPVRSRAEVRSVSAIGEQYIDFVPEASGGAYLEDGAVIPATRTRLPTSIGSVLENANRLVETLPSDDLRTSLGELSRAFNGTGPDLDRILKQGMQLLDDAQQNLGPTEKLIDDAEALLNTQTSTSPRIRSLVKSLGSFTDRVTRSDASIRSLLERGTPALAQVNGAFQDLRPTLPILLPNLVNIEQALATYNPSLEQLLVAYPRLTTSLISTTLPQYDGSLKMDLRPIVNDPPPCTVGFLPPKKSQPAASTKTLPTPPDVYCKLPHNDKAVVRGVRNLPCLEVPGRRAATPEECRRGFAPKARSNPWAEPGSEPQRGNALSADDQFSAIGGVGTKSPREEDLKWQNLLLGTIGH